MSLLIAGRQKKIPRGLRGGCPWDVPGLHLYRNKSPHCPQPQISPPGAWCSVSSPANWLEHQASCGKCGEPGQPQVLPQERCKDGCYFEGKTKLWPAVSVTTAFPFSQLPFPSPPPQPLCYRTRGSRSSPRCQCLPQSPSFLSLHGSTCQDCGQGTTAPKHGCVCLDCWERAGWNDIFQGSMMAFPERVIPN